MATVAVLLILFLATLPFRRQSYNIFLALHSFLSGVFILGCYYHLGFRFKRGSEYINWM